MVDSRRMCPNCRAFISAADRVCPYCEFQIAPARKERPRKISSGAIAGLIPPARFTTAMILLLNFALFIASELTEAGRTLLNAGLMYGPAVFSGGEWWRLITAGFFHGGLMHILMNSWALFDLGAQVEEIYDSSHLVLFYFVSTITGFAASGFFGGSASVGASAGVFGLIGVMIAVGVGSRSAIGEQIRGMYMRWAIFGLVMSFLPGIDLFAHLGGLVGGFGLGYFAGLPGWFERRSDAAWRWASYVCLAITAYAFVQMYFKFLRMQ